jgi:DnaK suppressor protein
VTCHQRDAGPHYLAVVAWNDDRAGVLDGIETDLADIELALARLDAGTYDTCEVCGAALDDEALAVAPTSRRCSGCG